MASQSQSVINVTSPGTAAAAAATANGPPPTSTSLPGPAVLTSTTTKAQTLIMSVQPSQSQPQQQANNIEPMDKSSSNTLKVRCMNCACLLSTIMLDICCAIAVILMLINTRIADNGFVFYSVIQRWS